MLLILRASEYSSVIRREGGPHCLARCVLDECYVEASRELCSPLCVRSVQHLSSYVSVIAYKSVIPDRHTLQSNKSSLSASHGLCGPLKHSVRERAAKVGLHWRGGRQLG